MSTSGTTISIVISRKTALAINSLRCLLRVNEVDSNTLDLVTPHRYLLRNPRTIKSAARLTRNVMVNRRIPITNRT